MAFDSGQFRELIEKTLKEYRLHSPAAANLLMGTAAQESRFGTYLRQIRGPALGVFQMEPATFDWLQRKYGGAFDFLLRRADEMVWDLRFAILMARLRYRIVQETLPPAGDIDALAAYWKKYYNTEKGAGTVSQFVLNWMKYVK